MYVCYIKTIKIFSVVLSFLISTILYLGVIPCTHKSVHLLRFVMPLNVVSKLNWL